MAASKPSAEQLITENIDVWTSAIKKRGSQGRGSNKKIELYGIKKLRELILELAIRGLLVPQNSNDEPASVLLEKIAAEKEQLIIDGKLKKQKPVVLVKEESNPFLLPIGWEYARFIDLAFSYRVGLDRGKAQQGSDKEFKYFKMNNILNEGGLQLGDITKVDASASEVNEYKLCSGDFLFNTRNSKELVGKTCVFFSDESESILYNNNILRAKFLNPTLSQIVDIWMRSPSGTARLDLIKSGTTNVWAIYQGKLERLLCVLPPEAEQIRIVAKVTELMALCDQLEQQTETSLTAHQTLVETLLNTLLTTAQTNTVPDPASASSASPQTTGTKESSFDQAWNRIAQHFDVLFTTEHSIDQLKQTILQLAVMGKLVPQDPNDEPASVLLEKIAAEKEQLIKDKKIKKQKALPPIGEDEKTFELPSGWEWVRFASLSNEIATGPFGTMIHKRDYIEGGVPLINPSHMINSKVVEDSAISVTAAKSEELRSYKLNENDIVMARRGEMGRCALVTKREDGWLCGTGSFVLRFNDQLSRDYILLLFRTRWIKDYLGGESIGTTMTNLNHSILNKLPLLLPPRAEVPRIISRVSELMALCEVLKKRISESQVTQLHLADAVAEQGLYNA